MLKHTSAFVLGKDFVILTEDGVVISRADGKVVVKMIRKDACKDCNLCESLGGGYRSIEAVDPLNVSVGDRVQVEINPKTMLALSFLVFIVPLIFLVIGYFTGMLLSGNHSEGAGIVGALTGLTSSFLLVRFIDKRKSQNKETLAQVVALINN